MKAGGSLPVRLPSSVISAHRSRGVTAGSGAGSGVGAGSVPVGAGSGAGSGAGAGSGVDAGAGAAGAAVGAVGVAVGVGVAGAGLAVGAMPSRDFRSDHLVSILTRDSGDIGLPSVRPVSRRAS